MIDPEKNERFRRIREETGLSQEAFGRPMAMTRDEVKNVEYNKTNLRDDRVALMCKAYNVNPDWYETGEGDMQLPQPLGDAIGEVAAAAAKNKPEEAMAYFQQLYKELGEAKFLLLYEVMKSVYPLDNEKKD